MATLRKQLSFFLANKPGTWVRIGEAFKEAGVNILAITVADTIDHAVVRIIVDNPNRALEILEERGVLVLEEDVVEISLENSLGAFSRLAAQFAEASINIDYVYGSLPDESSPKGTLYMHLSPLERAKEVLNLD